MVKNTEGDLVRLSPSNWIGFIGLIGTLCVTLVSGAWMMSNAITELRVTTKSISDTIYDFKAEVRTSMSDVKGRLNKVESKLFGGSKEE